MLKSLSLSLLLAMSSLFFATGYGFGIDCAKPTITGPSGTQFSFTCTNTEPVKGGATFLGFTVAPVNIPAGTSFSDVNTGACEAPDYVIPPGATCNVSFTFTAPPGQYHRLDFDDNYRGETHLGIFCNTPKGCINASIWGDLTSIAITPADASLIAGLKQQFTATGTFSDHSTHDITDSVQWGSSDTRIATISNTGLAYGVAPNDTSDIISATDNVSNTTASTPLTVTPWQTYYANGPGSFVYRTFVDTNGIIYAATNGNGLAVSRDQGQTWTNYTTANGLLSNFILDVYVTVSGNTTTIYVAVDGGGVAISSDGGNTWTNTLPPVGPDKNVFSIYVAGDAIYAGSDKGVSVSTDGGQDWTLYSGSGAPTALTYGLYVTGSGANATIYASTYTGGLSVGANNGTSWSTYKKENTTGFGGDFVSGAYAIGSGVNTTIYAATDGGLSISSNNGASWSTITTGDGLAGEKVWGVYVTGNGPTTTIYAATVNDLSVSHDNGANWTTYLNGDNVDGIYVTDNAIYASTQNNGLLVSTDDGTNWTAYTINNSIASNSLNSAYAALNNNAISLYAATGNGLSVSYDNGANWTTYAQPVIADNFTLGVYALSNAIYVATVSGLSVSLNNGANWATYDSNTPGFGSNYVPGVYAIGNTIYAATGGGLSISPDNGASWQTDTTNNFNNGLSAVYAVGNTIYAGVQANFSVRPYSPGSLAVSLDNGATWNTYLTLGNLSVSISGIYAVGENIYVATNEGLQISTDNGGHWTTYFNTHYVSAVYALNGTIYAATDQGVEISTDGGTSWQLYTDANGLGANSASSVAVLDLGDGSPVIYAATSSGLSRGGAYLNTSLAK